MHLSYEFRLYYYQKHTNNNGQDLIYFSFRSGEFGLSPCTKYKLKKSLPFRIGVDTGIKLQDEFQKKFSGGDVNLPDGEFCKCVNYDEELERYFDEEINFNGRKGTLTPGGPGVGGTGVSPSAASIIIAKLNAHLIKIGGRYNFSSSQPYNRNISNLPSIPSADNTFGGAEIFAVPRKHRNDVQNQTGRYKVPN